MPNRPINSFRIMVIVVIAIVIIFLGFQFYGSDIQVNEGMNGEIPSKIEI